ncbi:MAG: YolD-like family protein [Oscillospiraceae bacterium]|nr:YolD-like family protein [Oscillospiraceae bacterium]
MSSKYDDIIDMPHHVSETRPQMPVRDRAAQFIPFAALTGFKEKIEEESRVTEAKPELDEQSQDMLNMKQQLLKEIISEDPEVTVTYFVPDEKKSGGSSITVTGILSRLDEFERVMALRDGTRIPFDDILDIESEQLSGLIY